MKPTFILCAIVVLFASSSTWATSIVTRDRHAMDTISYACYTYKSMYGKWPTKWSDIDGVFLLPIDEELFPDIQPTKRYAFLDRAASAHLQFGTVKIHIIGRSPFHEKTFNGILPSIKPNLSRYVIYENEDGYISNTNIPESKIIEIFSSADQELPPKDTLGKRSHEIQFHLFQYIKWTILGILAAYFTVYIYKKYISANKTLQLTPRS